MTTTLFDNFSSSERFSILETRPLERLKSTHWHDYVSLAPGPRSVTSVRKESFSPHTWTRTMTWETPSLCGRRWTTARAAQGWIKWTKTSREFEFRSTTKFVTLLGIQDNSESSFERSKQMTTQKNLLNLNKTGYFLDALVVFVVIKNVFSTGKWKRSKVW